MNQRIKELAKQSGICFGSDNQPEGWRTTIHGTDVDLKKFAERIVRVCAGLVNQEALCTDHVSAEMNEYAGQRLKNAFMRINEHFGVKE